MNLDDCCWTCTWYRRSDGSSIGLCGCIDPFVKSKGVKYAKSVSPCGLCGSYRQHPAITSAVEEVYP
jgi:hypothetical protein